MTPDIPTILPVPDEARGMRLDLFLQRHAPPSVTRGSIQRAIREGNITVDGKTRVKPSSALVPGQTVRVAPRTYAFRAPEPVSGMLVPLRILHEDPQLLAIDKPAGFPVHGDGHRQQPTLVDALRARYPTLTPVGDDPERPGIVHRLDKDTSGVLLVARTPEMFQHLTAQFRERRVKKHYVALVRGALGEATGIIKLPLTRSKRNPLRRTIARGRDGKDAETHFDVRERFPHYTLLDVFPITGRMHQIRVHLAHLGFPIVGDALYGRQRRDSLLPPIHRQLLHAAELTVTLPSGTTKTFESSLPDDFRAVLAALRVRPDTPGVSTVTYRWRAPRRPPAKTH